MKKLYAFVFICAALAFAQAPASIPSSSSSGSTSPGGSDTQLQVNGSSSFAGTSGLTWDASNPGLYLNLTNPKQGADANDRRAMRVNCTTDSSTSNPNFSDENCVEKVFTVTNGQALYGNGTNAKKTFLADSTSATMTGSGQKILKQESITGLGMSDTALESRSVTFAGGPIAGDEGQGFSVVNYLKQLGSLARTTINSAISTTTCNTTLTQNVTASATAQTVTVASATGCSVNDYVVIGQEAATGTPNESLMQITAVGSGTLTGVIVGNYSSGATVTPATWFTVSSAANFGQDRYLVNLTASAYTTGTVASISGGGFTGSGTTWANGMVGGSALVPGCVALTNDDFSGAPFNSTGIQSTLKSWYAISSVASTTSLGVLSYSVAGDAAYHGNGVGSGGYTVRPCAKVLKVSGTTVILETNSFTWTNADSVEQAIVPYADVTGFQYQTAIYSPGGVRRAFMDISNTGARTYAKGIYLDDNMASGGDTVPWNIGFQVGHANTSFSAGESTTGQSFSANATVTSATTKTPGYTFSGGSIYNAGLGTGMYADYDTGAMFFRVNNVRVDLPATSAAGSMGITTGTLTSGHVADFDSSGRIIDSGKVASTLASTTAPTFTGTTAVSGGYPTATFSQTSATVNTGDSTITVNNTTGYPTAGLLVIIEATAANNEIVSYTGTTSTTFTGVTHSLYGTTATTHTGTKNLIPITFISAQSTSATPDLTVLRWGVAANNTHTVVGPIANLNGPGAGSGVNELWADQVNVGATGVVTSQQFIGTNAATYLRSGTSGTGAINIGDNLAQAVNINGGGGATQIGGSSTGTLVFPAQKATTGTRYLCIDTAGAITSSASACSGT